ESGSRLVGLATKDGPKAIRGEHRGPGCRDRTRGPATTRNELRGGGTSFLRPLSNMSSSSDSTVVLASDQPTVRWCAEDFDPANYRRTHPALSTLAVRLLLDAGMPLPWE
ncbi:MAG: hypothetical protein AAGF12_10085, partial [Myxococcota bacterium]